MKIKSGLTNKVVTEQGIRTKRIGLDTKNTHNWEAQLSMSTVTVPDDDDN